MCVKTVTTNEERKDIWQSVIMAWDLLIGKDRLVHPTLSKWRGIVYTPGVGCRTPIVNANPSDLCRHFTAVSALACSDDQEHISIVEQLVQMQSDLSWGGRFDAEWGWSRAGWFLVLPWPGSSPRVPRVLTHFWVPLEHAARDTLEIKF